MYNIGSMLHINTMQSVNERFQNLSDLTFGFDEQITPN